jgi:tetratricopeptide (TPR) repeat protein
MKVSEAFLVNTKNFESIIEALVAYQADNPVINSSLLEALGYSDPNDFLVVRLLKDFKVINSNGEPDVHYEKFHNSETTKQALAQGMVHAYEGLFEQHPTIHQEKPDQIKEAFEGIFEGKKTDLIIKYISGTFQKVVSYIGVSVIDTALKEKMAEPELEKVAVETTFTESDNGFINGKDAQDLLNDFDAKKQAKDSFSEDETPDITVKEFKKEEIEENEDDPFDFINDLDPSSEQETTADEPIGIDQDPFGLETSLSAVTQNSDQMNSDTLTKEHDFIQKALFRKSDLLHKMQRWEDLLPALEEIIKRFDSEKHPDLKEAVSRSIIRRATTLVKLKRIDEALPALSTVISRFKDSDKQEFYDQASMAMLYKTQILEKQGGTDLLPLYNAIISRLDSSSDLLMKEKLDQIHLKRFDLILETGKDSEILDASTKLVQRFKNNSEHQDYLQIAMMKRAEVLDKLNRDEEALEAYDEFLALFGK